MKWCYPWHKSGMYPPIESKYFTFRKHFKYFKVLLCQLSLKNYLSKITIITLVLSLLHITSKVIFLKEKWNCLTPLFKKFQKHFITSKTKVLSDHIWPAMISLHYLLFSVFLYIIPSPHDFVHFVLSIWDIPHVVPLVLIAFY